MVFVATFIAPPQVFALAILTTCVVVGTFCVLLVFGGRALWDISKRRSLSGSNLRTLTFCFGAIFVVLIMPWIKAAVHAWKFDLNRPGYEQWIADFERGTDAGISQAAALPKDVLRVQTERCADGRFVVVFLMSNVGRIYSGYIYVPKDEPEAEVARSEGRLVPSKAIMDRVNAEWYKWTRY